MKQRMRRISALLLVVLMCVSMVVPAFAAESAECPAVHKVSNCNASEPIATYEAGCGKQGYTVYQCEDCGDYFADDFVESLGEHEYTVLTKAATCTEEGYVKSVCYNCGDEKVSSTTPALNHMKNGVSCMEGPCDEQVCSLCGYVGEAADDGHNWGEPELKRNPSHREDEDGEIAVTDGQATIKCLDCGKTKTVPVSCLAEHTWVESEQVDPTCTTTGTAAGKKCSGCGKVEKLTADQELEAFATIAVIACVPEEIPVIVAPDCTEAGKMYQVCTMCEKQVGEAYDIAPVGHNYQTKVYTVEEDGYTLAMIWMLEVYGVYGEELIAMAEGKLTEEEIAALETEVNTYEFSIIVSGEEGDVVVVLSAETLMAAAEDEEAVEPTFVYSGEMVNVPSSIEWAEDCVSEQTIYNYNCTKCADGAERTVLPAGHVWVYNEELSSAPNCGEGKDGYEVYVCANPNCSGKGEADVTTDEIIYGETEDGTAATKSVVLKANHTFETKEVKATCQDGGYKYDVCACGAEKQKNDDGTDRELADGHYKYDIVEADPTAHVPYDRVNIAATCEDEGKKDILCSLDGCSAIIEADVVIPATGHVYDPNSEPDVTTTADCDSPAEKKWLCEVEGCGKYATEEISGALGHSWSTSTILPTCAGGNGYTTVSCSRCGEEKGEGERTNIVTLDKSNPAHHVNGNGVSQLVVVERINGNCTTPDLVYYECMACKDANDATKNYTFKAYDEATGTGHDFTEYEEVKATCVNDGKRAHKICDECGFKTIDGTTTVTDADLKIAKLTEDGKHNVESLTEIPYKAPTCTEAGNEKGYQCSDCGAFATEDGLADANATKVLPKLDHMITVEGESVSAYGSDAEYKYNDRAASCELWGYNFLECSLCGDEKIVNYVPSFGGHKLVDVEEVEATCTETGVKAHKACSVCSYITLDGKNACTEADLVIAKVAHKNADDVEFYGTCVEAENEEFDFACVVCEATITPDHEWSITKIPATCMEYSYELHVCIHCEEDKMMNEGFTYSDDHIAWSDWYVETPATAVEAGKKVRVCACGAKEEAEIPALNGVEFDLEVENAVYAGAEITNSGLLALTVKTKANDLAVWGLAMKVKYDTALALKSTDAVVKVNDKFADVDTAYNTEAGVITIVAYASTTNTSEAVLDGEEALVTIYFRVPKNAEAGTKYSFSIESVEQIVDMEGNYISAIVPEDLKAEAEVTARIGLVNADNVVDLNDAKAMMLYITGEAEDEYCSAADINLDGEIDAADFTWIQKRILGTVGDLDLAGAYNS